MNWSQLKPGDLLFCHEKGLEHGRSDVILLISTNMEWIDGEKRKIKTPFGSAYNVKITWFDTKIKKVVTFSLGDCEINERFFLIHKKEQV